MKKFFKLLVMGGMLLTIAVVPAACSFSSTPTEINEPVVTKYTVKFDSRNGTNVADKKVVEGGVVREPVTTRDGYTFTGWYEEPACNNKFDFTSQILCDITLYAGWIANAEPGSTGANQTQKYTVTFDCDGGSYNDTEIYKVENIDSGTKITAPVPTRASHLFLGWYKTRSQTDDAEVSFDQQIITSDCTFYAHWTSCFAKNGFAYEINNAASTSVTVRCFAGYISKLVIPGDVKYRGITYKVTEIGDEAFKNNESLVEIAIPRGMDRIGENAFNGCSNLERVVYGDFENNWLSTVKVIGVSAFNNCRKLKDFDIANVKEIGEGAFANCAFIEVVLSATKMGKNVFCGCHDLKEIICMYTSKPSEWQDDWDAGIDGTPTVTWLP